MKILRYSAALVLAFLLGLIQCTTAFAGVDDFTLKSFHGEYYLGRDDQGVSTLKVEETLVAQFPNFDQNHGILRSLPDVYEGHGVDLKILKVTKANGEPWNYTTYGENDNVVLKIGDADKFVQGEQTYIIHYTMRAVTLNLADRDEFYWDVNGDDWRQPFGSVTARVHFAEDISGTMQDRDSCYTGVRGSKEQACTVNTTAGQLDGPTVKTVSATKPMGPGENLSFAIAFNKATFASYKPDPAEVLKQVLFFFAAIVALPLIALIVAFKGWWTKGRDPEGRGVIIPEYLPPKGLSVLESDTVLKMGMQRSAISAQIIDLAVRHYLKIYEVKEVKRLAKDKITYELELLKDFKDLRDDERQVIEMIFKDTTLEPGSRVKVDDLKNKLYKDAAKLSETVTKNVTKSGYFLVAPDKASKPYLVTGIIMFSAAIFLFGLIGLFAIGLGIAGAIVFIMGFFIPARTIKGVEIRDYMLGLKDYMKLAEADRLKVLQSPRGSLTEKVNVSDNTQLVKLYERLLPFAMLFGIEQEWANQFADLYKQPPDWYSGSSGAFHAANFSSGLHSFGAASAASFVSPSSSGSGGSGGGGFSGGGGGGGGGGGW